MSDAWQLPQLREDNRAMLELLRAFEWGHGGDCDPGCPSCGGREHERHHDRPPGHATNCPLGALLAKHPRPE